MGGARSAGRVMLRLSSQNKIFGDDFSSFNSLGGIYSEMDGLNIFKDEFDF